MGMLVLSRERNEKVYIGDNIEVMVVEIQGGKVRLGITAPLDIPIVRDDAKKGPRHGPADATGA